MFYVFFILAIIPCLFVINRIFKFKDINIFDLTILFSLLYFWLIPCKEFVFGDIDTQLTSHVNTAVSLCIYMWTIYFIYKLIYSCNPKIFNISRLFISININVRPSFLWIILAIGLFYFYNITNYSALSSDNVEANNQFQYGLNMPFYVRIFAVSIRPIYPILIIITYNLRTNIIKYKRLRIFCLLILFLSLILGEKTFMIYNLIFFAVYLYSIKRNRLKRKHIYYSFISLFCVLIFLFPILQGFRIYKQYSVEQNMNHDFLSVVKGFVRDGITDDMQEKIDRYQDNRSLGCYNVFDWTCNAEYRGNGYMTWLIFRYVIPQRAQAGDGNIVGDKMIGKGADVAESILAWFVLDYGFIIGPIVAVLYQILICILLFYFGHLFSILFDNSLLMLVSSGFMTQQCINVEHSPTNDIRIFYALYIIVFVFIGLLTKYYVRLK